MFGTLTSLVQAATPQAPPKDVPPPTEIKLPCCHPQLPDPDKGAEAPPAHLVTLIQSLYRPPQLSDSHFRALGVHVYHDASSEQIVPDPALLPQETGWDDMTPELAANANKHFQQPLSNGNNSPDARIYCDRRKELSAENQAAFRTLRRIRPEAGKQAVRLGGSYEFFKQMDLMAGYWDDTSLPPKSEDNSSRDGAENKDQQSRPNPATPIPHPIDASLDQAAHALVAATTGAEQKQNAHADTAKTGPEQVVYRTAPGNQMPASFRHDMVGAFIKLVAYDFGCNISVPRVEPRLYIRTPSSSPPITTQQKRQPPQNDPSSSETTLVPDPTSVSKENNPAKEPVVSHFPSGCTFLNRTPITRDAARAGIVEGPVLSISIRNATSFASTSTIRGASPSNNDNLDSKLDFGRELVAALATAQLRNREGKEESRLGEGKWWATRPRWGGGEGGPIGREVDGDSVQGDKDAPAPSPNRNAAPGRGDQATRSPPALGPSSVSSSLSPPPSSHSTSSAAPTRRSPDSSPSESRNGRSSSRGQPAAKRTRKTLSIYDNYRMVRKPTSNWDKKARYMAIGKQPGADYDDIFVLSSLFHHFSVLRVRVQKDLLDVLDGNIADLEKAAKGGEAWGKLEIWRSKWFDLFIPADRLDAMRLLWGVMMWQMRKTDDDEARAFSTRPSAVAGSNPRSNASGPARDQKRKSVDLVMRDADAVA